MQEKLSSRGYSTGAAVSSIVLRSETGLARGFDFYEDRLVGSRHATAADVQRTGVETLAAALPWLRSVADEPFLLLFHLYEPHTPLAPPEPFASAYPSPYDAEIAAADHVVGQLIGELESLGIYDRALVILLSDHGEGLGDHGELEHGVLLYRQTLQIPLILKLPGGRRSGETVATPVQLSDVAQTVLSVVDSGPGVTPKDDPLLGSAASDRPIYSETFYPWLRLGWSYLLSMISDRYHYIQGPDPELYDLREDPEETRNILSEKSEIARELRLRLRRLHVMPGVPEAADADAADALRSLGYLGSTRGRPTGRLPDPKTRMHVIENVRQAIGLLAADRVDAAAEMLEEALDTDPRLVDAWQFLSLAYSRLGRTEDAVAALREAYRLSDGPPELAGALSRLLVEVGKTEDATQILAFAIESSPENPRLRLSEARALLEADRLGEALASVDTALRLAPRDPEALYVRGRIHMEMDDPTSAEADLRSALALDPDLAEATRDLAVLLMETGRADEAARILESRADGSG